MQFSAPLYILKRNAHRLAKEQALPLHAALDQVAQAEGFATWGLLVSQAEHRDPADTLLQQVNEGDLVLIGARPQQGKTTFAMQLGLAAMQEKRRCYFFSLDYVSTQIDDLFAGLGASTEDHNGLFHFDDADEISAQYLIEQLESAPRGSLVIVDYLQAMEADRSKPPLKAQIPELREFSEQAGLVMVFISQVDRRCADRIPTLADIKVSNPFDLGSFKRTCFLYNGQLRLAAA